MKRLVAVFSMVVLALPAHSEPTSKSINVEGYDLKGYPVFEKKSKALNLAPGGEYGRKKIAQWGDPLTPPQTRTRCVSEAWGKWPWGGEWRTCNGWATDYKTMQVEVFMKGLGPADIKDAAVSTVESIVATCVGLSSAVAVSALWATPSPEPAARIAAAYAGASATFTGCITGKASELTAVGVTTAAIQLAFDSSSGWSNWSNE